MRKMILIFLEIRRAIGNATAPARQQGKKQDGTHPLLFFPFLSVSPKAAASRIVSPCAFTAAEAAALLLVASWPGVCVCGFGGLPREGSGV